MTTADAKSPRRFRLPDPPEREPDDRTSAEHLSETGLHHHLKQFLGNPETTIVSREKYITAKPGAEMQETRPAGSLPRGPLGLPRDQRVRHLGTGQATGPGARDSLPSHWPH